MWGCLRTLVVVIIGGFILLYVGVRVGYRVLGVSSFEELVKKKIEETLEARLERDVTVGSVTRVGASKVIVRDIRIANAPGGVNRYFATVGEIEITGGIDSLWQRRVRVGRIDIRNPRVFFEVFPAGSPLTHNFPKWKTTERRKRRFEIGHLDLGTMYITGGGFLFLDRRHDISADATNLTAQFTVSSGHDVYEGLGSSPLVRFKLQDYEPIDLDFRGGFRYTPGVLELKSLAFQGRDLAFFISGKLDPLTEAKYDLRVRSELELARVREIFRVQKTLGGRLAFDAALRGKQGDFTMDGGWTAGRLVADVYDLAGVRGRMNITDERAVIDVDTAGYAGGTIGAHYTLAKYAEPYPMNVELRYDAVSLEKVFSDWGLDDTGLRGAATGRLTYDWEKDRILAGGGEGTARLAKSTRAFSNAKYPIPLAGATDFTLNKGVVAFRSAELDTEHSHVSLTGTLRIEDMFTDFRMQISSKDFAELDRIGYNFAHAADKDTYELLGLGGAGTIGGTLRGPIKTPQVAAHIEATGALYNNTLLGDGQIDLRYDGAKGVLELERGVFRDGDAQLALNGTITFPDRGPSPRFDLAVETTNYPASRALAALDLELAIGSGKGTGKLIVTGTPESGKVTFLDMVIRQPDAELRLNGDVAWLPGKGNVRMDLTIAARDFPIGDIITFLDLGEQPVTGKLSGTLHLEGPKASLEGAGAITVREGVVFGEPVDVASAELVFTRGKLKLTNFTVTAPAGEIKGEAELDMETNQFSYTIQSQTIDLSKLQILSALKGLLGGNIRLTSSGAGTFDQPELVVEATLTEGTLRGLTLPPGSPPPTLYIAIRGGKLIVRGAIADLVSIEGNGSFGPAGAIDGLVRIVVSDVARLAAMSPKTAALPVSGNMTIDLQLGGKITPIEALRVDGTIPVLNLRLSEHDFSAARPLRFALRDGRLTFDDFEIARPDSNFTLSGFAEFTGGKRLDINARGSIEAALLQLFVPDLRADGHANLALRIGGTLSRPELGGTAELLDAQMKFEGFPQLIDDINGRLVFRRERIDVESLQATLGGGTVGIGGFIAVDGLVPRSARISLQGSQVAIRYFEGLTIEGDFTLLLSGDIERMVLQGDVNVTRANYFRDFDFQQSVLNVILSRRGLTPVTAATWQERVDLRLDINAPNTLAVKNNVADVTGSADFDVTGTLASPIVIGEVTLNEGGTVRFQNVDYTVVRGTIDFQNPFRIDPYFDITLEGRLSGNVSEIESGPIDVTVNLTGTLDRMTPTITSDPPASDITLFSLLGAGAFTGRASASGTGPGVIPGVQSVVYQSLVNMIGSRILPFADSFTFDPGFLDTQTPGPKVTFEKRLSNNIRVLVVYNLENHKSREVIEWLVNRDWTLQFTRNESENEYRLEARFRRRYEGHWTWGQSGQEMALLAALPSTTVQDSLAEGREKLEAPNAAPPGASVVSRVDFRTDGRIDTSTLTRYLSVAAGRPLSRRDLQASIKALYGTGNFRDIRVDSSPAPDGGVALTFMLSLHYRVGSITFVGLRGGDKSRAEREMTIRLGETLSLNAVERSAEAIDLQLERTGYLEATVDPETEFLRDQNRADVTFHVTTGPLAKVATVSIEGDIAPFTREELIKRMRRGPGRTFRIADARRDAERMKSRMLSRNHRKADVDFLGHVYDPATDSVTLRYRAVAGPLVKVEVAGVPRRAVRRVLPFRGDQEYSEDTIERAADDIIRLYQQRGHYDAAVDIESGLAGDVWTTTFKVEPGPRYKLAGLTFTGNQQVSDKTLQQVIATSPRGGFRGIIAALLRRPGGVTREQLRDDRDALESFYRLEGFSEATVATPVVDAKPTGEMTIQFPITEGPQTILAAVRVEGAEQVRPDRLPKLQLEAGDPFNPQLLREDLIALQSFYADRGNAEVQIKERVDVSADKTSAELTYVVSEGPRIKIDDVVVRGNTYTNSETVLRTSDVESGDPFSYTKILEAQRNLYRLGVFQRVDIEPEQAGTTVSDRNVVIRVEEGKNLTVSGSLGVRAGGEGGESDFSPRVAAAVAHRNLFGTGRYLGLETVLSQEEREVFLTFREPYLFQFNVPLQVTLFQSDDSTRKDTRIRQTGAFIEASKVARLRTRWSVRYEYKISRCEEGSVCTLVSQTPDQPIPGLDKSLQNIQISSVTPTFFWDRRDDIVDPHRGFFTSASIEYAFPLFRSETRFLKEFVQGAWYLPVSRRSVFAISGRAGLIHPIGPEGALSRFVPLSERFTAGGESSHRAFRLDLLGTLCRDPRDYENDRCSPTLVQPDPDSLRLSPLGGNGMFLMNAEYRFPIFATVGGTLFVDAGNVFASPKISFDNLRWGVGTGLRYLSPVGPLRFDVGYKLDRRIIAFDEVGNPIREDPFAYVLTVGYAF